MTDTPALITTRDDAIVTMTITRPQAKNSLNEDVLTALGARLDALRHDDSVRAIILTGAGGVFCAGADITAFDAIRAQSLLGPRPALGGDIWAALGTFTKPVIAAVEGLALGGGLELVLACDIAVAGRSARLGVPEVKLGVIPGGGGTQRLIRACGKARAMAMLLTGDVVTAQEARDDGIISELVDDGDALDAAHAMAARIAGNSPLAVALAKDAALRAFETTLSQGLELEKRNFDTAVASADSHEGQSAFLAKRKPEFTGR
ncbi:enoyl-CoA hydratase/isomerase family protein [Tomitella cavernea]|uniref:Enoyl-CoA hydratase-related protein n=1 Tax=Tomitella cavernea TaxID=1387982 RepID=A0ABP9CRJ8_9ACTN|nr:enoyl-CoA hydratase-related protein [Tomitella cavernea]